MPVRLLHLHVLQFMLCLSHLLFILCLANHIYLSLCPAYTIFFSLCFAHSILVFILSITSITFTLSLLYHIPYIYTFNGVLLITFKSCYMYMHLSFVFAKPSVLEINFFYLVAITCYPVYKLVAKLTYFNW